MAPQLSLSSRVTLAATLMLSLVAFQPDALADASKNNKRNSNFSGGGSQRNGHASRSGSKSSGGGQADTNGRSHTDSQGRGHAVSRGRGHTNSNGRDSASDNRRGSQSNGRGSSNSNSRANSNSNRGGSNSRGNARTNNNGGNSRDRRSSSNPFGLDIVAPVRPRKSDAGSKAFWKSDDYKYFKDMLRGDLTQPFDDVDYTTVMLDPSRIKLQTEHQTRAYFVQESAGYHNTLGFSATTDGETSDRKLIFPNASSGSRRTRSTPLKPGDFVDLGTFSGGTKLDFFLIADGARGGGDVFSTDASVNPDGVRHAMSHAFVNKNSPYLLLAFEDLFGGGDQDYNDLVVALDIGAMNVDNIVKTVGAPEPATMVSLATFFAVGVGARRRMQRKHGPHRKSRKRR